MAKTRRNSQRTKNDLNDNNSSKSHVLVLMITEKIDVWYDIFTQVMYF